MARDLLETDADLRKRVEQRFNKRKEFAIHAVVYGFINGGLWLFTALNGNHEFWPLFVSLGWGAGLIGHAIDTYFQAGAPARARDQALWRAMRDLYGGDWRETATRAEYAEVQHRIGQPFEQRKEFGIHFGVYAAINLMLWLIYFSNGGGSGFPWPMIVSVLWGIGLAVHAANTWFNHSQEAAIEREVQRERERLSREMDYDMKRKRDTSRLQRTVDGDILEIIEEPDVSKAKRRSN